MTTFRTIETNFLQQIEATLGVPTKRYGSMKHDDRCIEFSPSDDTVATMRLCIYGRGVYRLTSTYTANWRSPRHGMRGPGYSMELTVLPSEVETMTPFFVAFHHAHMHNDASRLIPSPVELWSGRSTDSEGALVSSYYGWTLAAENAYESRGALSA